MSDEMIPPFPRRACQLAAPLLVLLVLASAPAPEAHAVLLPEDTAAGAKAFEVRALGSSGGPPTRAGHLAESAAKPYLINVVLGRDVAAGSSGRLSSSGQVAWLGVLLAMMCGLARLFGRELQGGRFNLAKRRA